MKKSFTEIRNTLSEEMTHKKLAPMVDSFVKYASDDLGIKSLPTVELIPQNKESKSFGGFIPSEKKIVIVTKNRHPMDIFRTLAHEMVHCKQYEDGKIGKDIRKEGETGSPQENEANSYAGVLMRNYAKMYPEMFESSAMSEAYNVPKDEESGLPKKYTTGDPETDKARKRHWKKMSKYDDDDPRAYQPAPGDKTAKTKESKYTKKAREMFGEEYLEESEKALKNKAEKSGVSLETLKKVYKRGVAAWNSGHRPGTNPQQWGMARVNSYITKGKTYHTADKDLHEAKVNKLSKDDITDTRKLKKHLKKHGWIRNKNSGTKHDVYSNENHPQNIAVSRGKISYPTALRIYNQAQGKFSPIDEDIEIFFEELGAGEWGTDELAKKYVSDTPGQQYWKNEMVNEEDENQLVYNGKSTNNFDMCPAAKQAFEKDMKDDDIDQSKLLDAISAVDNYLGMEKQAKEKGSISKRDFEKFLMAVKIAKDKISELGGVKHDYHKTHINNMEELINVNEDYAAPMWYGFGNSDGKSGLRQVATRNTPMSTSGFTGAGPSIPMSEEEPTKPVEKKKKKKLKSESENNLYFKTKEDGYPSVTGKGNTFTPFTPAGVGAISEGLQYMKENNISLSENVYRYGSEKFFETINEARELYTEGKIELNEIDQELIRTNIGEFAQYNNETVPLDLPLYEEDEKNPPLNKPKRGGPKKFYVYVKDPSTGNIKKVTWGDTTGLSTKINDPEARKSFAARHKCSQQKDRTSAAYWACNTPRYAKALGLSGGGNFYW